MSFFSNFAAKFEEDMRKITFISAILSAMLFAGCHNEPCATIEGTIGEANGKILYLDALGIEGVSVSDSVKLKADGAFCFHVSQPECFDFYRLRIERELVNLSVDSTETITVEADLPTMAVAYQVKGSDDNMRLKELVMKQMELQNAISHIARHAGSEIGIARQKVDSLLVAYKNDVRMNFIYPDPSKPYAYFALFQRVGGSLIFDPVSTRDDVKAFAAVATNLDLFHPGTTRTQNLHNIAVKGMSHTRPARPVDMEELESKIVEASIIDLELPDADGAQRKLTDLKGKLTLLSFTAYAQESSSMSVLTLRELYGKYASQGLEIYQVGLDENEHYWRMAVDNLPWVCVHDADCQWYAAANGTLVFQSSVASLYGVKMLPTYFLINREGEVVLRIEDEQALPDIIAANI